MLTGGLAHVALIYYRSPSELTISIILMTGQSFAWRNKAPSISRRRFSAFSTTRHSARLGSARSLGRVQHVAVQRQIRRVFASVNGWLLDCSFPVHSQRLRLKRALFEWLEAYGDIRVRKLVALTMVFLYILYLVTQFRAFRYNRLVYARYTFGLHLVLIYLCALYDFRGIYIRCQERYPQPFLDHPGSDGCSGIFDAFGFFSGRRGRRSAVERPVGYGQISELFRDLFCLCHNALMGARSRWKPTVRSQDTGMPD